MPIDPELSGSVIEAGGQPGLVCKTPNKNNCLVPSPIGGTQCYERSVGGQQCPYERTSEYFPACIALEAAGVLLV